MKITILKDGRYLDQSLKARKCKPGDVLETRGWYADEMIRLGVGKLPDTQPPEAAAPAEEPKPEEVKPEEEEPKPRPRSKRKNPFIEG